MNFKTATQCKLRKVITYAQLLIGSLELQCLLSIWLPWTFTRQQYILLEYTIVVYKTKDTLQLQIPDWNMSHSLFGFDLFVVGFFVCVFDFFVVVWFLFAFFFFLSFSFREQQQFTADKIFKKKWLQLKKLPDFLSRFIRPSQHCFSNQISTGHFF